LTIEKERKIQIAKWGTPKKNFYKKVHQFFLTLSWVVVKYRDSKVTRNERNCKNGNRNLNKFSERKCLLCQASNVVVAVDKPVFNILIHFPPRQLFNVCYRKKHTEVNFINVLWAAFTRDDPKSAKKRQGSCQSFCTFMICMYKSCS